MPAATNFVEENSVLCNGTTVPLEPLAMMYDAYISRLRFRNFEPLIDNLILSLPSSDLGKYLREFQLCRSVSNINTLTGTTVITVLTVLHFRDSSLCGRLGGVNCLERVGEC